MAQVLRRLAVVTGASSGIGYELARQAAMHGYDVVVASDEPRIEDVVDQLGGAEGELHGVQVDLSTMEGVDRLYDVVMQLGRPVDALFANVGRGLGHAFVEQDWLAVRKVIDTNITGTVYTLQRFVRDMAARGEGKVLVTGSIAGFLPGAFSAVYNGTKAFIDSFTAAIRNELKDSGVSVTCLMPGPTDTAFFERAEMMDTDVGTNEANKSDAAEVARVGYDAMVRGDASIIYGLRNKVEVAASRVLPQEVTAEMHRKRAAPGTAKK